MLRPISPELVLFLDFWVSNIPRYFCFCLDIGGIIQQTVWMSELKYILKLHFFYKIGLCESVSVSFLFASFAIKLIILHKVLT